MFQSQLDFARSGNAGNQGDAAVVAGFGEGFVQTRADGENCACVFDGFELFGIGYRTRADDGVRHFFGNQADGVEADGGAQGDFEGGDAAFDKGVGQIDGGAQVVNRHHRHNCAGCQNFTRGQFGHFRSPLGTVS